jgi:tellurite resistance protein TerC
MDSIGTYTPGRYHMRWLATLLLMVVLCLEVTDLIFAVDSVSAIVAEVPDLFIAYTASVFAMLGLRAMFFVTDELMHLFILLKYGIAAILVVIGIKLILSHWVEIHPLIMLAILLSIFVMSILGSLLLNMWQKYKVRRNKEPETQAD